MYDQILVPTDGSDGSETAIAEAVELAVTTGAAIHGLYVVDTRDYNTLPESKWLGIRDELDAAGESALSVVRDAADAASVPVETTLRRGIPTDEILAYAEERDVDLVVMATHGRTGVSRFLLGSVTEKVLRQATVPVHVVHVDETT